jgi:sirohydrochlorin ferrochelatase
MDGTVSTADVERQGRPVGERAAVAEVMEQLAPDARVSGPPTYDSFEEVFAISMAASPFRTEPGVRRGLRHNMCGSTMLVLPDDVAEYRRRLPSVRVALLRVFVPA